MSMLTRVWSVSHADTTCTLIVIAVTINLPMCFLFCLLSLNLQTQRCRCTNIPTWDWTRLRCLTVFLFYFLLKVVWSKVTVINCMKSVMVLLHPFRLPVCRWLIEVFSSCLANQRSWHDSQFRHDWIHCELSANTLSVLGAQCIPKKIQSVPFE